MTELRIYRIGNATITCIPEMPRVEFAARQLLPDWDPERLGDDIDWMVPTFLHPGRTCVSLSIHSWLLEFDGRTILIDAGTGNGKSRAVKMFDNLDNPFMDRLASAGVRPEDVDHILITHLHTDHVGWLTMNLDGRWIPTFPNAKVFMPRIERDRKAAQVAEPGFSRETSFYVDSVLPVLDRTILVESDGGEVLPGLTYLPTPGHSIGHMSIELESGGVYGLFAGDVMHHPSQVRHPEWSSTFSEDSEEGQASRRWALNRATERRATVFSSHFPEPSAGTVERVADGFRWRCA